MHHLILGINFQIHFVSLASLVAINLPICMSNHLCHHYHSENPVLLHSFMVGSKRALSTNPFHHNRLLEPPGLPSLIIGLNWIYRAHQFIFSSFFVKFLFDAVE